MKILIASSGSPKPGTFDDFCRSLDAAAADFKVHILGYLLVNGPGCYNHALDVKGDDADCERFGNALCLALMPAKWCETQDSIPEGFNDKRGPK